MAVPINQPTTETMFHQHAPGIRRLLLSRIGDENSVDDILQVTFIKLNQHLDSLDPLAIRAWMYRVAINQANMLGRRKQVETRARERLMDSRSHTSDSPETEILRQEKIELARRLLDELPENQQTIVRLKFYQGMTFAQIASQLETPLGTVLSRMRAAMKVLSKLYERSELNDQV